MVCIMIFGYFKQFPIFNLWVIMIVHSGSQPFNNVQSKSCRSLILDCAVACKGHHCTSTESSKVIMQLRAETIM